GERGPARRGLPRALHARRRALRRLRARRRRRRREEPRVGRAAVGHPRRRAARAGAAHGRAPHLDPRVVLAAARRARAAAGVGGAGGGRGLPGGGFGHGYGSMGDLGSASALVDLPLAPEGRNAVRSFIPVARIADLLLQPGAEFDYDGKRYTYPDVRLVHWAG